MYTYIYIYIYTYLYIYIYLYVDVLFCKRKLGNIIKTMNNISYIPFSKVLVIFI